MTNLGAFWGAGMSLLVGALSRGLRRARKGLKKTFQRGPQNRGCGRLKKSTQIRLEGVKMYSPSVSQFFTGRLRVLHGGCRSAPQRARFGSWALWWSAIANMRAGAGQVRPGPSSPVPSRSPSQAPGPLCRRATSRSVLARVSRARSRHMRRMLQRPAKTSQCSRF